MKTTRLYTLLALLMVFVVSCTKPDEPNNSGNNDGGNNGTNNSDVRVTTYTPLDITPTTAKCGGDAIVVQGLSLTEIGVCWSKEQNPMADQAHLSTTVWNEPFVCTITGLEPNTKYYVRAYALRGLEYYYGEERDFITLDRDYVDLGLPSGILWATCNVGAETPEEYGDYFAWGETFPKEVYDWNNYQHSNGMSHGYSSINITGLTKYCNNSNYGYYGFTDNLATLLPEDDAATANWGNAWRMPTKEEWEELFNSVTSIWTTQNHVKGLLFTALNGNSLFLPATGFKDGESGLVVPGMNGDYWSSSLDTDIPDCAWRLVFHSAGYGLYWYNRSGGQCVRPVRSTK